MCFLAYLGMDGRKGMGCLARMSFSAFLHAGCNAGLWGRCQSLYFGEAAAAHQCVCRRHRQHIGVSVFYFACQQRLLLQTPQLAAGCHCGAHLSTHCIPTSEACQFACLRFTVILKQLKSTLLSLATRNRCYTSFFINSLHNTKMQWTDARTVRGADKSSKPVHFHSCRGREILEQYPCRMS